MNTTHQRHTDKQLSLQETIAILFSVSSKTLKQFSIHICQTFRKFDSSRLFIIHCRVILSRRILALKGHRYVFHKLGQIIEIKVGHNLSAMPSGHTNTFHVNFKDVKTFLHVANDENLNWHNFFSQPRPGDRKREEGEVK